jgi:hypothetical protein
MLELYNFSAPECEGSETGGMVFGRQLSRRLQAHVGRFMDLLKWVNCKLILFTSYFEIASGIIASAISLSDGDIYCVLRLNSVIVLGQFDLSVG